MAATVLRRSKRCQVSIAKRLGATASKLRKRGLKASKASKSGMRHKAKKKTTTSSLSTSGGSEEMDVSSDCSLLTEDTSTMSSGLVLSDLRAVVINLDRRPDRMEVCSKSCSVHCPWLQYSRLPAADGKKEDIPHSDVGHSWHTGQNCVYQKIRSIRKGWDDLDHYVPRELRLSAGERGCSMSHVRAWRHCIELNRPLVVLEDDAVLMPEFTPVLSRALDALPTDAQLLYLGYSQAAPWRKELSAELVESEYVWTTVAYIIWPSGANLLLSQLPVSQPVDNWMASFSAAQQLKAYAVRPKIVRQAEEWNVASDVLHSDEAVAHTIQAVGSVSSDRVYVSHDTHHSVDLWSQAGVNQQWSIARATDGLCTIKTATATHGGRVFLSHDTHHNVDLWCDAGDNQRWIVKMVGQGMYTIQAASPTSEGRTFLGSNGRHGLELFADGGEHQWLIPESVFDFEFESK